MDPIHLRRSHKVTSGLGSLGNRRQLDTRTHQYQGRTSGSRRTGIPPPGRGSSWMRPGSRTPVVFEEDPGTSSRLHPLQRTAQCRQECDHTVLLRRLVTFGDGKRTGSDRQRGCPTGGRRDRCRKSRAAGSSSAGPRPVAFRQVTPGRPGPRPPPYAVDQLPTGPGPPAAGVEAVKL